MEKYFWEIKDFYEENKSYCIAFLVVLATCITCVWVLYDYYRNEPVYNHTNSAVADIERRVGNIESRVDSLSDRLAKAEKTVSGTIVTIREGRENAAAVADGISGVEKRLDSAIQRSGRIENLIEDIESANR